MTLTLKSTSFSPDLLLYILPLAMSVSHTSRRPRSGMCAPHSVYLRTGHARPAFVTPQRPRGQMFGICRPILSITLELVHQFCRKRSRNSEAGGAQLLPHVTTIYSRFSWAGLGQKHVVKTVSRFFFLSSSVFSFSVCLCISDDQTLQQQQSTYSNSGSRIYCTCHDGLVL